MMQAMTKERLRQLLEYDPITGIFRWKSRATDARWNVRYAGKLAGTKNRICQYLQIKVDKRTYQAHRLAWLYMTGNWPIADIDHADRNRENNRFSNLREATRTENCRNRSIHKNNRTGLSGINFHKRDQKFVASISCNGERIWLGQFGCIEDAQAARLEASLRMFGEFSPDNVGAI